jgi:hypothetical protein
VRPGHDALARELGTEGRATRGRIPPGNAEVLAPGANRRGWNLYLSHHISAWRREGIRVVFFVREIPGTIHNLFVVSGPSSRMSLFGPRRNPGDFNCARVHRGEHYVGGDIRPYPVRYDFRVIHGEAEVRPGRPILVLDDYGADPDEYTTMETFYIFPVSEWVRVALIIGNRERSIFLWREEDRNKSRMYKQRVGTVVHGFADAVPAEA